MIIACPACGTRYAVPDAAIGSDGRTVRCAKCKHSWFQDPQVLDLENPVDAAAAPPRAAAAPTPPPATPAPEPAMPQPEPESPRDGPSINHWRTSDTPASSTTDYDESSIAVRALRRGLSQNTADGDESRVIPRTDPPAAPDQREAYGEQDTDPPFADEEYAGEESRFGYRAPFLRRRNTLKLWTFAAAIFAVLATGTIAAVNYYSLPDWFPLSQPTFGIGQPGLELDFPPAEQRPETLENGETMFRVRGTITNTARETLTAPNLLVVFSDARERKVGDWVVVPAKRQLAPGETVTVTEAIANIPPGAAVADLGWAPN